MPVPVLDEDAECQQRSTARRTASDHRLHVPYIEDTLWVHGCQEKLSMEAFSEQGVEQIEAILHFQLSA